MPIILTQKSKKLSIKGCKLEIQNKFPKKKESNYKDNLLEIRKWEWGTL